MTEFVWLIVVTAVAGWVMPRRHTPKSLHGGLNVKSGRSALRLINSRANAVFEGARHLEISTAGSLPR